MPNDRSLPKARAPLSLLIADDNRDAADSLAVLLALYGHNVRVAYDGAEAVRLVRADPPDCAILDIGMPTVDGLEAARQIRANPGTQRVKLVAHTAYADDKYEAAVRAAGFDHHLIKGRAGTPEFLQVLARVQGTMKS
jgi:CheY-like chemotaxis protein